jgi:hypothetical protein
MDNQSLNTEVSKPRADAMKVLLIAGLSVQACGVLMAVSLLVLNFAR